MVIDGRGRKIDERKKKRVVRMRGGEREGAESQVERERKKIVKKLYAHVTVPMRICTVL